MERKTGARGLRTILENTLLDTMYEIPSHDDKMNKVVVNQQFVMNKSKPFLVYNKDSNSNTATSKKLNKKTKAASSK